MSTAEHCPPIRTAEEFIAWEEQQDERYEFVDGVLRMMTGGTLAHNWIIQQLTFALRGRLPRQCMGFSESVKLVIRENVLYPDYLILCGAPDMQSTRAEEALLVAEVLSPSTPKRELDRKQELYLSLPGLRHYLVLSQDALRVAVYTPLSDGGIRLDVAEGVDGQVGLSGLECSVPIAEIYDRSGVMPL